MPDYEAMLEKQEEREAAEVDRKLAEAMRKRAIVRALGWVTVASATLGGGLGGYLFLSSHGAPQEAAAAAMACAFAVVPYVVMRGVESAL